MNLAFPDGHEALRLRFRELAADLPGVDTEVYARFGADPLEPVIGRGDPRARVGFFGRDPGRDEVQHGEPFIGAGGQLVRRALHEHLYGMPLPDFETSRRVGRDFFWANTVPYKPFGNKAWSTRVKQRFQPAVAALLLDAWQGQDLIVLGREAFLWFGIHQGREERARIEAYWESQHRFERHCEVLLSDGQRSRPLRLHPLPHPSPLNATWYGRFPGLLKDRLTQLGLAPDTLRL
jgi:uracil-DNA glycosylase family 4